MMSNLSCDIVVIGAGLAGLTAANYLKTNNYHTDKYSVKVIEKDCRVGGRIATYHQPNGLHFEQGAFSFGDGEKLLWEYIHQYALPIIKHTQMDRMYCFKNHTGKISEKGPFLKSNEQEVPLYQLFNLFRGKLEQIEEDISLFEALQSIEASSEAIEWLQTNTILGLLGNGFKTVSTKAALAFLKQYDQSTAFYSLRGGNDQLPKALADTLKGHILLNHNVRKVEQLGKTCLITGTNDLNGKPFTIETNKVIFAIPLPELNKLSIIPPLSIKQQEIIQKIVYTKHARMLITAPSEILSHSPRGGVFLFSDQAGWFRDQSLFQAVTQKKTVFDVSVVHDQAEKLSQSTKEWQQSIDQILFKNFPKWDPSKAKYETFVWKEAYSCFPPKMYELQNCLHKSEEGFLFTGEHTHHGFASMNGAMESGVRAAKEIIDRLPRIRSSL